MLCSIEGLFVCPEVISGSFNVGNYTLKCRRLFGSDCRLQDEHNPSELLVVRGSREISSSLSNYKIENIAQIMFNMF